MVPGPRIHDEHKPPRKEECTDQVHIILFLDAIEHSWKLICRHAAAASSWYIAEMLQTQHKCKKNISIWKNQKQFLKGKGQWTGT